MKQSVGDRLPGTFPFGAGQCGYRESPSQPYPEQHILEMPFAVADPFEIGGHRLALLQQFGINLGVLDIPPPHVADEPVRPRSGAPPVSARPVALVVTALATRPAPVGHLVPLHPRGGELTVDHLIALGQHVIVGSGDLPAAHPAGQRGALFDHQGVGRDVVDTGIQCGQHRGQ